MLPLSKANTARLLCKLSPRPLKLDELDGANSAAEFVQRLAQHPLTATFAGNAGLVKAMAPKTVELAGHTAHPVDVPRLFGGHVSQPLPPT